MKYASIGSISRGTLKDEDLIDAFTSELEWQIANNGDHFSKPENHADRDRLNGILESANEECYDDEGNHVEDSDILCWHIERLSDALGEFCRPYTYFGAHWGDGADFGFWPAWDSIEELPCIEDNTQECIDAEQSENYSTDVRYVNDHGNVTVYGPDGSVVIELV